MAGLLLKAYMWLDPSFTNINRRKCHRVVPMEILCLGCSRTATTSLRQALKDLGYNETYHAGCVYLENPRDADMWVDAYKAKLRGEGKVFGKDEFDKLLGHCMAVTDVPAIHFKEELSVAYPDAKIVLTLRDSPEAWLRSVQSTLIFFAKKTYTQSFVNTVKKIFTPRLPFQDMNDQMATIATLQEFENTTADHYIQHNESVRELARARDAAAVKAGRKPPGILEFNVKSGWRPLCEFLGKPIPRDEHGNEKPFPRLNDTATFRSEVGKLNTVLNTLCVLNIGLTVAGAWALFRAVSWGLQAR